MPPRRPPQCSSAVVPGTPLGLAPCQGPVLGPPQRCLPSVAPAPSAAVLAASSAAQQLPRSSVPHRGSRTACVTAVVQPTVAVPSAFAIPSGQAHLTGGPAALTGLCNSSPGAKWRWQSGEPGAMCRWRWQSVKRALPTAICTIAPTACTTIAQLDQATIQATIPDLQHLLSYKQRYKQR